MILLLLLALLPLCHSGQLIDVQLQELRLGQYVVYLFVYLFPLVYTCLLHSKPPRQDPCSSICRFRAFCLA